jgi:hypothetical protein
MKRVKSSVVGLLVSLSLALTSPTFAQFGSVTGSGSTGSTDPSAFTEELGHRETNIDFGGQNLSWRHVMNIAKDPVISWGAVQDEYGRWVDGEVWLIVARNKKFIYFHLTDTPNTAQNTTAYGGYTVKIKASMSIEFYGIGSGGLVPLIGNDTDTFLVTTTEMLVNSTFVDGEMQRFDVRTGAEIPYLVHLYDVVESYGMSTFGSRGSFAIQYFAPDGTELIEPFYQTFSAQASSSYHSGCAEAGEDATNSFLDNVDRWEATQDAVSIALSATAGIRIGAAGIYGEFIVQFANFSWGALGVAGRLLARNIVAPLTGALAEGLCESLQNPDVLPPIEVGFNSPDLDSLTSDVVLVCDAITSEYVGSSGTIDEKGNVTVTGHRENVCTEWHHEVVS